MRQSAAAAADRCKLLLPPSSTYREEERAKNRVCVFAGYVILIGNIPYMSNKYSKKRRKRSSESWGKMKAQREGSSFLKAISTWPWLQERRPELPPLPPLRRPRRGKNWMVKNWRISLLTSWIAELMERSSYQRWILVRQYLDLCLKRIITQYSNLYRFNKTWKYNASVVA